MNQLLMSLIVLLGTWPALAVVQDKAAQQPAVLLASNQSEQTKNAVELAIDESQKKGDTVVGSCLQDCDEKADSATGDKGVTAQIIELPKPAYPPVARAAHVSGAVDVQVLIDFDGTVIAAAALGGHPLLQGASVDAARNARFGPTVLAGQPVKVTGIIRYTFTAR
ncbi:MAG TPA: energy transducer TonB [Pyrinomonadaceae bacterium]|nr:energy transducer TonB [Pyrinomonadaceae bacterium]